MAHPPAKRLRIAFCSLSCELSASNSAELLFAGCLKDKLSYSSDAATGAKDDERCSESEAAAFAVTMNAATRQASKARRKRRFWRISLGKRGVVVSVGAYVAMHALGVKDLAD